MAAKLAVRRVQHEVGAAAAAAGAPAAGFAGENRRVASPVDEDEALLSPGETLGDALQNLRGEAVLGGRAAKVDGAHGRQLRARRSAQRQRETFVAADLEVMPALERRRGRAEHDRAAG